MTDSWCLVCGVPVQQPGRGPRKLYCSGACKTRSGRLKNPKPRTEARATCKECGLAIESAPLGRPRQFCSDRCKLRFGSRITRRSMGSVAVDRTAVCPGCGDTFTTTRSNRIYCYDRPWCAESAYRARSASGQPAKQVPHDVTCAGCGKVFTGIHPKAKWCSSACASSHWSRARSRTRRSVAGRETYSDRDIFIRDNWTCHLCGLPIDPLLDRNAPLGATVDHVLALANGGLDDVANVAAAHRSCNAAKGART